MTRSQVTTILLPLVGLVAVLAIGFGGAALLEVEATYDAQTLEVALAVYWMPLTAMLTTLLTAGGLLWLLWRVMTHGPRSRLVAVIYLLVGFFGLLYSPLAVWMVYVGTPFELPLPFWTTTILDYTSLFSHAAGGAAMAGLLMLVLPSATPSASSRQ